MRTTGIPSLPKVHQRSERQNLMSGLGIESIPEQCASPKPVPAKPAVVNSRSGPWIDSRRGFLRTSAAGIAGLFVFSDMGEVNAVESNVFDLKVLDELFSKEVAADDFVKIAKGNFPEFLKWYKSKVAIEDKPVGKSVAKPVSKIEIKAESKEPDEFESEIESKVQNDPKNKAESVPEGYVESQIKLEDIGRSIIEGFSQFPGKSDGEKAALVGDLFPEYTEVIKRNAVLPNKEVAKHFIQNGLKTCDLVIHPDLQSIKSTEDEKREGSKKFTTGILDTYEAALIGVSKLEKADLDAETHKLIFEVPWDSECFGEYFTGEEIKGGKSNETQIKECHDRMVKILSDNYFGQKKFNSCSGGLDALITRVAGSVSDKTFNCGWAPYILYGVIEKNPEYFSSIVTDEVKELKKQLLESDDITKSLTVTEDVGRFFRFFAGINSMGQSYYFPFEVRSEKHKGSPSNCSTYYPAVPVENRAKVNKLIKEQILGEFIGILSPLIERQKIKVFDTNTTTAGRQRSIDANGWNGLNAVVKEFTTSGFLFQSEIAEALRKRLATDNSYEREMNFQTLGISFGNSQEKLDFELGNTDLFRKSLGGATSPQEMRGVGFAVASALNIDVNEKMPNADFIERINLIIETDENGRAALDELRKENLTNTQKFIIDSMSLVIGGYQLPYEIMGGGNVFPRELKTYQLVDGQKIDLDIRYGFNNPEESVADDYYRYSEAKLIKSEFRKDEQDVRDIHRLFRTMHNGHLALAYLASGLDEDRSKYNPNGNYPGSTSSKNKRLKANLEKFLLRREASIYEFDRSRPEFIGEKVSAMLELNPDLKDRFKEILFDGYDTEVAFSEKEEDVKKKWRAPSVIRMIEEGKEEELKRSLANEYRLWIEKETKINIPEVKKLKKYEDGISAIKRETIIFKLRMAEGFLAGTKERKLAENRKTFASMSGETSTTLNAPFKYLDDTYHWKPAHQKYFQVGLRQ
jgi:hypothetical protein